MTSRVQNPKDFWTGLIYLAVGTAVILIARNYSVGTASRMGPGYFPLALAGLLILLGLVAVVRSFIASGGPIGSFAWKPLLLVLVATALFGALVGTLGLIVALLALVLTSAAASERFQFDWRAVLGLVALIVFCSLVFVKGLGVPMPLFGPWLEPLLGSGIAG
ncbi:MAG: tripartite tricarboxylate transporter TctB family protein [Microvirga sp.]